MENKLKLIFVIIHLLHVTNANFRGNVEAAENMPDYNVQDDVYIVESREPNVYSDEQFGPQQQHGYHSENNNYPSQREDYHRNPNYQTSYKHHTEDAVTSSRVIATKYGNLRGIVKTIDYENLGDVEAFLGVPYAEPPVGSLRLMPPVTPAPWTDIRPVQNLSPVCPQRTPDIRNMTEALQRMTLARYRQLERLLPHLEDQSEDCLYLNIYTPVGGELK